MPAVAACVVTVAASGCATVLAWRSPAEVRAPDRAVANALGDGYRGSIPPLDAASIPLPPEPTNLRPCCVFGADLRIAVGAIPVPGFSLSNIRGPADLGPHKYNVGLLAIGASDSGRVFESENNGIVYTCRGGFLDVAHIRDSADMTVYLEARIARIMETGGVIELSDLGGKRRILLNAIDRNRIANIGRRSIVNSLAQWLAFQISVWHEIQSWYGPGTVPGWSEKVSAFSPEDLYSNLLGIKLAGGVSLLRETTDERRYNEAMDAWIAMAMKRLQAVPRKSAEAAMHAVAGIWWDPTKRLPDWKLTTRRRMDIGPILKPWVVSMAFAPDPGPYTDCANAGPWLALNNPDDLGGIPFVGDATLQIDVSGELVRNRFPLPRKDSQRITQADFPFVIEGIRRENAAVFGEHADQPAR